MRNRIELVIGITRHDYEVARRFFYKILGRTLHHGHEVLPAIVAELSRMNWGLLLVMAGLLLIVFGVQALILQE